MSTILPPSPVKGAPGPLAAFLHLFPLLVGLHRRHLLQLARLPRPSRAEWQNPQVPLEQDLRVKRFPFDFYLFPLDGGRGLARHVVDDAVDAGDLVDDAGGDPV